MLPKPLFQSFATIQPLPGLAVLALLCASLIACDAGSGTGSPAQTAATTPSFAPDNSVDHVVTTEIQQLTAKYLDQIESDLTEVSRALTVLQSAEAAFLLDPSVTNMEALRDAWLSAHIAS